MKETKYYVETYNGFDDGYDVKVDTNNLTEAKKLARQHVKNGYQSAAVAIRHYKYIYCAGNRLPFSSFQIGNIGVSMTLEEIKYAIRLNFQRKSDKI